jgi:hexosaminidase
MIKFVLLIVGSFLSVVLHGQSAIVPQPVNVTYGSKYFDITASKIHTTTPENLSFEIDYLRASLRERAKQNPSKVFRSDSLSIPIVLQLFNPDTLLPEGLYSLKTSDEEVFISAPSKTGIFYGIQSLLQLCKLRDDKRLVVQETVIRGDYPRFAWRGMHLDVSRHFFPIEFIKRYIDMIALHKMNVFHWHLTDDQGWRIEIKQFPKLTEIGGWRNSSMVGHYSEHRYDSLRYGGFYTQAEIREVVQYATLRKITIVPEIEMPGHAMAALTAYPEFSCNGGPFTVPGKWGVFDDVFCPKEETFQFLEKVLDEVCTLFPGKFIHIGGDECPKTRWKTCKNCQKRIQDENLKDEHELQSYFIQRMEKYLNGKGRQIIGWDEILEGGLAPKAAVMSWRGTEGGIEAARLKHPVVMTPGSHCYFDHYQGNPRQETVAIGGFTPLEKVYQYDPIPADLNAEERKYILGAQANVWTEYIPNKEHVEYMALPRMAAMAEVLWSYPEKRDYADFFRRIERLEETYENKGYNYSVSFRRPQITTFSKNGELWMKLNPPSPDKQLNYRILQADMSILLPAQEGKGEIPISIQQVPQERMTIEAWIAGDETKTVVGFLPLFISRATAKAVELKTQPSKHYPGSGSGTLTDGVSATLPRINSEWLGWSGDDVEMTLDLGAKTKISEVSIGQLVDHMNWIYEPSEWKISVSEDGLNYQSVATQLSPKSTLRKVHFKFIGKNARYVRIEAKNPGKIPDGKAGAGESSWMMFDEIFVN